MFEDLKRWIIKVLSFPNFTPVSPWKEDPAEILFCRLVMLGSVFSLVGVLVIGLDPVGLYFILPSFLRFPFISSVSILLLLSTIFGIIVYVYERRRMSEWLAEELDKMPHVSLLTIAQKEGVSIEEEADSKVISQMLMSKLKRKDIEKYVFGEEVRR